MRVPPLPADEWDDEAVQAAIVDVCAPERRNPQGSGNAIATLVQHPALAGAYLPFSAYLLAGSTLPAPLRELAILRLAHRSACSYEWIHHVEIGKQAGLSDADIAAARSGDAAEPLFGLVLHAVDELLDAMKVSDATWGALSEHLDRRQLMDLVFTVGGYLTLAMGLNSFGVEPEDANWRDTAHDEPGTAPAPTRA